MIRLITETSTKKEKRMKRLIVRGILPIGLLVIVLAIANNNKTTGAEIDQVGIDSGLDAETVTGTAITISDTVDFVTDSAMNIISLEEYMSRYPTKPRRTMQSMGRQSSHLDGSLHTEDCYTGNLHVCDEVSCEHEHKDKILLGRTSQLNPWDSPPAWYISGDGFDWAEINPPGSNITYVNEQFMVIQGKSISTSSDGISWDRKNIIFHNLPAESAGFDIVNLYLEGVVYGDNGYYYGVGSTYRPWIGGGYLHVGVFFESTDLVNWYWVQDTNYPPTRTPYNQKASFVITSDIDGNKKLIYTSSPGDNSASYHAQIGNDGHIGKIDGYGGGSFVIKVGKEVKFVSPSTTNGGWYPKYIYGRGMYYLIDTVMYSKTMLKGSSLSNMQRIEPINYPDVGSGQRVTEAIYFGDKIIIMGRYSEGSSQQSYAARGWSATSVDGITWQRGGISGHFDTLICNADGESGDIRGSCLKKGKYYNTNGQEVSPICNEVVTEINPTNAEQTIKQGEEIIKTANVIYLNGSPGVVDCTTDFRSIIVGKGQKATLVYKGYINNAKNYKEHPMTITVDVESKLEKIEITNKPTGNIYTDMEPTYTVTAHYSGDKPPRILTLGTKLEDGKYTRTITPSSPKWGSKTVGFTYREDGHTVNATVSLVVKPNLKSLSVFPTTIDLYYGDSKTYELTAHYEDGKTKALDKTVTNKYENIPAGESLCNIQEVFSYEENNIIKTAIANVVVKNYPKSLSVALDRVTIYQGEEVKLKEGSKVTLANGDIIDKSSLLKDTKFSNTSFDNEEVGVHEVTYTYALNDRDITTTLSVEVLEDLKSVSINASEVTIHKGDTPDIRVTAYYNTADKEPKEIDKDNYSIVDFDASKYDREGKTYKVRYTEKGVTKEEDLIIKVLPDVSKVTLEAHREMNEGEEIDIKILATYEDGLEVEKKTKDKGVTIEGYDPETPGYQTVTVKYKEGNIEVEAKVIVRVRARLRVTVPKEMLINLNTNTGEVEAPKLTIDSLTKEKILISIESVEVSKSNQLKDVSKEYFEDWNNLGKEQSKNVALALGYSGGSWFKKSLDNEIYIVDINNLTSIGVLEESDGITQKEARLKITGSFGTAVDNPIQFSYNIKWYIKLAED